MKNIEFESYNNDETILSATNTQTKYRIAKMPANILFRLSKHIDKGIEKSKLVTLFWGKDGYFIRRSFDVHLANIKRLLIGTYYEINYIDGKVILNKTKTKNNGKKRKKSRS